MKSKDGKLLTKTEDQLERWKEHFQEVLNRPPPVNPPNREINPPININTGAITKAEIMKAIKSLKNGKASGIDNIPPEALKAGDDTIINWLHKLLNKMWTNEEIPDDWRRGLMIKLPKKGDTTSCQNWRGITLLSIPSKVLASIILSRMKTAVDKQLRDEQAGFRQERSCVDQIATLRIIIEQSIEWQTSLYMTFIDFEKAFDSVNHKVLWNILETYGIPAKIISIIKQLYINLTCQVLHAGTLTHSFPVTTGVRQWCLLSPLLFLVTLDWVCKTAFNIPRGIRWTMVKRLEDIDFADDICMISHRLQFSTPK